jgi:hypothetical protein
MARPANKGLDYYPFDTDFFSDMKIRKLIRRQGGKAVTVYACALCFIYKNGYYIGADNELPFIISEQTGFDEAYIQQVLECCFSLGLFDKELYDTKKIITSKGIQERYSKICSLTKKRSGISEYNLITSEEMPIITERMPIITERMPLKEKKRKVNKNTPLTPLAGGDGELKKNENSFNSETVSVTDQNPEKEKSCAKKEKARNLCFDFISSEFREVFMRFVEYRKSILKPYRTQQGLEAAYRQLTKYSGGDPVIAAQIVERSIANEWQGLFEIKQKLKNNETVNSRFFIGEQDYGEDTI